MCAKVRPYMPRYCNKRLNEIKKKSNLDKYHIYIDFLHSKKIKEKQKKKKKKAGI